MPDSLSQIQKLARETATWLEARLISTNNGTTLPTIYHRDLWYRLRKLLAPAYACRDLLPSDARDGYRGLLTGLQTAFRAQRLAFPDDWPKHEDVLFGAQIIANAALPAIQPGVLVEHLEHDPHAVAGVLTALRLIGGNEPGLTETVTLLQMASLVQRSKRWVETHKQHFPPPVVRGGYGKADEWDYTVVKPILERLAGRQLPEKMPRW